MFGLGVTELVIILIIVVIIFGAKKLPGIGAGLGEGITNFKKALSADKKEKEQIPPAEAKNEKEHKDA